MTRTWSACSATAAGCTGPGRSSTPWGRGRGALQAPHQPDHEGERHGRLLFQGRLQATPGQAERRPGSQHPRPRVQWLCAAHPSGLRPGLREGRCLMVVRLPARRPGQPADRRLFRGSRARHRPRAGRVRRAALPPDGHPGAPHGPRRRVRRRKDGAHARRVRYHAFPFQARQPVRQRGVESTDRLIRKELMYDNVCTSVERLRSDLNRYVWWYDHQRLHSTLDYMSPVEFTQQGKTLQEQSNTPLPIHALVVPSNLHMMKNLGNTLLCRPLCRRLYSGRQR